jgi:ubiquinone/menaquinone biosynthesis C-methylase UbiE
MVSNMPENEKGLVTNNWLCLEMLERFRILQFADISEGMNILEIGCGAHAMATIPLAYLVGRKGRIVAIDRARWHCFKYIIKATGMFDRIIPLKCDARHLPSPFEHYDLAVVIHGIRSFNNETIIVKILKEMKRSAKRVFICESLPEGKTAAQKAHLQMYNLREEIFEALSGQKDDLHYFSQKNYVQ